MNRIKNWASAHKPATIAISAAVAIALIVAGVAIAYPRTNDAEDTAAADVTTATDGTIKFDITADDGWTEDSTPAIAHIVGSTDDDSDANDDVDFYHAISASEENHGTSSVTVPAGDYTVEFVSPVNSDGSAYEIYDTGDATTITVVATITPDESTDTSDDEADVATDAEGSVAQDAQENASEGTDTSDESSDASDETVIEQEITKIPADQVTDEMLKDIIDKVNEAVENGDETLKGEAGQAIVDKLADNVAANPNASDETKADAEETTENDAIDESPAQSTQSSDNGSSSNNSSSNSSNSSSSNNSSSGSSNSGSTQSTHVHNWVTTYETVTKTRTVVDTPESTSRVLDYVEYVFPADGYVTRSESDAFAHQDALFDAGLDENYSVKEHYKTVTTPAVTHTETYTEQVATGQHCTGCNATK